MAEDNRDDITPQKDEPPNKEPILFNWLVMFAGIGVITLTTIWLTK